MISVSKLNRDEITNYFKEIESFCMNDEKTLFIIECKESLDYFKARENDCFLFLKYSGENEDSLRKELHYIKLPERSYGEMMILKCNKNVMLHDMTRVLETIEGSMHDGNRNPLLGWIFDDYINGIEVHFITKVYDGAELENESVCSSLLEAVFSELSTKNDTRFCESLKKLNWNFKNDTLEFQMQGMTRSGYIMSLKKEEIENLLFEYTGRTIKLKIV